MKIKIGWKAVRPWLLSTTISFCFLLFCGSAIADCTKMFSWLPNSEPNIAGYKIFYGLTDGGPYPNVVDVGNPTPVGGRIQGTVTGLSCGQVYFFVCVAEDDDSLVSQYSAQVTATTDGPGPPADILFGEVQ